MTEDQALRNIQEAMDWLRIDGQCRRREADDLIDRTFYSVTLKCDGAPFSEIRDEGTSLAAAYYKAIVRRDDFLGKRFAA